MNWLRQLLDSHDAGLEVGRSAWDFALEIEALERGGATRSELRTWLSRGYLVHQQEVIDLNAAARVFKPIANLSFPAGTAFLLTEAGLTQARNRGLAATRLGESSGRIPPQVVLARPYWDQHRRELRVDDLVVKAFPVPAPNQEQVLAAFEARGWPPGIADPLPPHEGTPSRQRLHDCINALNRRQRVRLIRFRGDGKGSGIVWERLREVTASESAGGVKD